MTSLFQLDLRNVMYGAEKGNKRYFFLNQHVMVRYIAEQSALWWHAPSILSTADKLKTLNPDHSYLFQQQRESDGRSLKKSSQLSVPKSLLKWGRGAFQGCLWKWGAKLNRLLMAGLGNPSSWDCFTNLGLQAKLIFSYWNPLPNWIAQNAW